MKITKTAIDAMRFEGSHPKAKDLRWDDEVPGFGVRVYPSGAKSFFLDYYVRGREKLYVIGAYGVWTLTLAREEARALKVAIARGKDPLADRGDKRTKGRTVGELAADYLSRHAKKKKSVRTDEGMLRLYILPAWATKEVQSITTADITALHNKITEKGFTKTLMRLPTDKDGKPVRGAKKVGVETPAGGKYAANRAVALISTMLNLGKKWGYLAKSWANPVEDLDATDLNVEEERERPATPFEVRALLRRIDQEENIFVRKAIWGYLLCGQRKMTLLGLKWSDCDFSRKIATFTKTKKGKPFVMPMTPHIEQLLRSVPRITGNPYVFCGRRPGKGLVSINKNWEKIRADVAGASDIRIHDLRHTVITWLANAGFSFALIGKAVDQSNERTTKRYAHLQMKPAARVLAAQGLTLHAVANAETDAALEAIFESEDDQGSASGSAG